MDVRYKKAMCSTLWVLSIVKLETYDSYLFKIIFLKNHIRRSSSSVFKIRTSNSKYFLQFLSWLVEHTIRRVWYQKL